MTLPNRSMRKTCPEIMTHIDQNNPENKDPQSIQDSGHSKHKKTEKRKYTHDQCIDTQN